MGIGCGLGRWFKLMGNQCIKINNNKNIPLHHLALYPSAKSHTMIIFLTTSIHILLQFPLLLKAPSPQNMLPLLTDASHNLPDLFCNVHNI